MAGGLCDFFLLARAFYTSKSNTFNGRILAPCPHGSHRASSLEAAASTLPEIVSNLTAPSWDVGSAPGHDHEDNASNVAATMAIITTRTSPTLRPNIAGVPALVTTTRRRRRRSRGWRQEPKFSNSATGSIL